MADPQHVEPLDDFDRLTVRGYRSGLLIAAGSVAGMAVTNGLGQDDAAWRWAVFIGVALIVANLHLYDRTIRWFIGMAGWTGAVLALASERIGAGWVADAGLGCAFVVLSAVALKERYCFRVPLVVLVPPALAGALIPLRLGATTATAAVLGTGAAILLLLALVKLTMPLHFDIGDKRRYEV